MEKEPQPDSLSEVTVKQYAASEVYSSEPPPAYHRPQTASVQIARIAAVTLVAVSVVLGGFILAAAYVNANASCQHLQQELELLQEANDRLQPLQPEALTQEETQQHQQQRRHHSTETHAEQKEEQNDKEIDNNDISSQESGETEDTSDEDDDRIPIRIKLPLQLDFDELAGALMEKNQRSRMNCVVEKKKAEEVVDHQAKTVRLPFGLNLTTDPRYERVTGERMAIFCESGDAEQRQVPQQEDTVMVQPIIVPLPGPVNLPLQFQGHMQQQPQRPPMPQTQVRTIIMEQLPQRSSMPLPASQHGPPQPHQLPPHPLMQHIAQQIIAQHEMAAAAHRQQQLAQQQMAQQQHQEEMAKRHQEMIQRHHEMIRQQEIVQRQQEMAQRQQEMAQRQQEMAQSQQHEAQEHHGPETVVMAHRIPVPEEILSQMNRLPHQNVVVSVSEHDEEGPQEEVRIVQHQRENAQEVNGRQAYARSLPVHIPVPMMQQMQAPQPEEQTRPHYVQPRSVRSVDALLHREKRVKRCACDCAC